MNRAERILSGLAGLVLVAGAAHVNIASSGGYQQTSAIIVGSIALGVLVGAIAVPALWRAHRRALALALALGLVAGEAVALIATAERVIVARDRQQAPLQDAIDRHKAAQRAIETAQRETPRPADTSRLAAAEARLAAAEASVREKAAERGCASNCAALLKDAVAAARDEVEAARRELDAHHRAEVARLATAVDVARAALAALPSPEGSASVLADRLGVAPWLIDVVMAILASFAINGLGCGYLAAAAHAQARAATPVPVTRRGAPELRVVHPTPETGPVDAVLDLVEVSPGGRMEVGALYRAYAEACAAHQMRALEPDAASRPLRELCQSLGLKWQSSKGKVYLMGIRRRPFRPLIDGRNATTQGGVDRPPVEQDRRRPSRRC